jgi:4'-phosphopantetheinyl transferase EntD
MVLPREFGIVTRDSRSCCELPLLPQEQSVAQALSSEKRRREFAAGRSCARQALARLGIRDFPLLPGVDRAPVWPGGVVGSITHTEVGGNCYCAVAVAQRGDIEAIGIDAEAREALPNDLWDRVLDKREQAAAICFPDPAIYARLVFSAKEAVYKALYSMFRCFLDFPDIHIECEPSGTFSANLQEAARELPVSGRKLLGRFVIEQTMIMTGVALTAGSLQRSRRRTS